MQSKLFFLLFFIFIFSLTLSSNNNTRKLRLAKNILNVQKEKTREDYFQTTLQPVTSNLNVSNTIFSNLLETENEENSNLPLDSLRTLEDVGNSSVPSELLNKLLSIPNVFRYIFVYLSLFELELNLKRTSNEFYHLYEKCVQEEKNLLKECLKNEAMFLQNIKSTRKYFNFFEKRHWSEPDRIEYANVDYFSEALILLPKSIRQVIWFKNLGIEYKYILFKNGHLSILKKCNEEGNFAFVSLENDIAQERFALTLANDYKITLKKTSLVYSSYKAKRFTVHEFQENVRFMECTCLLWTWGGGPSESVYVKLYKIDNITQRMVTNHRTHEKIMIHQPYRDSPRVFLKNLSGYLEGSYFVSLCRFEKQTYGIYGKTVTPDFKQRVKKIKSKDFEHDAEDVLFIFNTDDEQFNFL